MATVYKIDKERKLVLSSAIGVTTPEEFIGHQDRLLQDPDFDPSYSQLIDLTQITQHNFGAKDIRLFARRNIFSPTSRRAIVVNDDLLYGLARMFEIHRELAGESGIRVFRDLDEAMNWIFSSTQAA